MLKTLTPLLGAFLLVGATSLYAQTTPSPAPGGDGTKKEKMKAAHQKARQACEGKKDAEHRDCMRTEICAQAKDPAKCEARWKEHAAAFNKAYDVCKAKGTADEFRSCMRQQHVDAKK
jgi:hypothetical protein